MKLGPKNQCGTRWTEDRTFALFYLEERMFLLDAESKQVWIETDYDKPLTPASREQADVVLALWKEDQEIEMARAEYIRTQAGDNQALAEVLAGAMWFRNREPELFDDPCHPGIKWGQVGRNSSHAFYLGVDEDGQLYRRSQGYDWDLGDDDHVEPIDSPAGHYLGHC